MKWSLYEIGNDKVNAWKKTKKHDCLNDFLRSKIGRTFKRKGQGADDDQMACGYDAVGIALNLLHLPKPVNSTMIAEFRAAGAKRCKVGVEDFAKKGVVWPALRSFIKSLGSIDLDVADKNFYPGNGVGVDALAKLDLSDGIYIIGGYSVEGLGHAFIGEVSFNGESVWIHDKDNLEDSNWWQKTISYVRRFQPAAKMD